MVNITVQLPEMDKTAEVEEVVSSINAMIDRYQRAYPDVTFHKAGIIAMNHAFMTAAQDDSSTLVPTMLVVILVFDYHAAFHSKCDSDADCHHWFCDGDHGHFQLGWNVLKHSDGKRSNVDHDACGC